MRQVKMILLLIADFFIPNNNLAQTIDINNVRYSFSGAYAIVSKYLGGEETCVIPETIEYNDLEYTVTTIGSESFRGSLVTEVRLPGTITTINYRAFADCGKLVKINIPSSLITIEDYAFCSCVNLTNIIIPEYVSELGGFYTFAGCSTLRTIIYLGKLPPLHWTATSMTYVPDKQSYISQVRSIHDAHVIEMITFGQTEFEYTGSAPNPTWTNNVEGYTASLSLSELSGEVGNHEEWVPATFTKGGESFTANVVYRYTIKPATLTAKVNNVSREYGEENPQFEITYSGFVNGEDENDLQTLPTIYTTATKTSNVGEYPITISSGSATNYNIVYEPGVLTITKAPLSAMVNDATKVYGSNNPSFTISYYGLKNGETTPAWTTSPTFQTEATRQSGVGQYVVNAVNGVPKNYDLGTITPGTLTITPAPLTIKANNAVRQYYTDNPTFNYTCDGFVNNDNNSVLSPAPTLSTTATKSSNVGTYEISVEGASSPNYSISYTNGTLTITPRTLMASVGNYSRPYNEENPEFEVIYSGFVGNDDKSVLNEEPVASTTATKTSDVGTYQINVSGGDADNYTFSYTSGILTINKAEQTITWNQDFSNSIIMVGDQIELQAVASSGLPITYTINNDNIAEVYTAGSKTYLDCFGTGDVQILAIQEGNQNYYSSPRIRKIVHIDDDDAISILDESNVKIQSTSFGATITGAKKGETVRVYTIDGKLRHSVEVDSQSLDIPLEKGGIYIIQVGTKTVKLGH